MSPAENTLWSLMAGGLLVTTLIALGDTLMTRSVAAVRTTVFIATITFICLLHTGLPELIVPDLPPRFLTLLNVTLGPLGCSIGLHYMSAWIGGAREDAWTDGIARVGSLLLLAATGAIGTLAVISPPKDFDNLQFAAALCELSTVLVIFLAALRAWYFGDPLARWLMLSCPLMVVTIVVLNLREMNVSMSFAVQALGAACTMAFLLVLSQMAIVRNRRNRQMQRSSRGDAENDPVTGLPTGAKLIAAVEHAFWRANRHHRECLAVCVHVNNLYELGDAYGHTINNQILAATSARIRRGSGFRCVVGVYHPRCFVIIFSQEKKLSVEKGAMERIHQLVNQPLELRGSRGEPVTFHPLIGICALHLDPGQTAPTDALNELEHRAMADALLRKATEGGRTTSPGSNLERGSSPMGLRQRSAPVPLPRAPHVDV